MDGLIDKAPELGALVLVVGSFLRYLSKTNKTFTNTVEALHADNNVQLKSTTGAIDRNTKALGRVEIVLDRAETTWRCGEEGNPHPAR